MPRSRCGRIKGRPAGTRRRGTSNAQAPAPASAPDPSWVSALVASASASAPAAAAAASPPPPAAAWWIALPRLASTRRDRERRGVCVVAVLNLVLCVHLACECEISSVVMMWWKGDLAVLLASVIFFFVSHEFL